MDAARTSDGESSKVMLVTMQLQVARSGGRELLCKLNHDALRDICGDRMLLFELPRGRLRGLNSIMKAFRGHIDGVNAGSISTALDYIKAENVRKIFIDGSNLGEFARAVKLRFPYVVVNTFFHNVEARFFLGSFRQNISLHALAVLIANFLAERKAVRYSDKIICLSQRDSLLLQRLYGRAATNLSPMALQDNSPSAVDSRTSLSNERFALFVGGDFYANRRGIIWFVNHVVPHISIKVFIVGRGFEQHRLDLERKGKVVVIGEVDSLTRWYVDSHFVIAPIFDGSGMKTKVAEALMFGKKIIGTPEAFSGYEDVVDRAGWVCTTAADFVAAIKSARSEINIAFDPALYAIFKEKYSYLAARSRLAGIIGEDAPNMFG